MKIAIVTDSNSGITQAEAKQLGIEVLPMPFMVDGKTYFEDLSLTQEQFYEFLKSDVDISTSQPAPSDVMDLWDRLLLEYDEIVHIPMSSGLSSSYQTARMLAEDYEGKVHVVNNQRISITQRRAAYDALEMAKAGISGERIKKHLEKTKFDSSIYITLETLKYLKKGGRITPAAAALGTLLKLKPVLQIQGEKLDAFSKARTIKAAKKTMTNAILSDMKEKYGSDVHIDFAYSGTDKTAIEEFIKEISEEVEFENSFVDPLSLSVSCHIGDGSIAVAVTKKLNINTVD